ncbi:MAG: URC4/urg3 family protein [Proteobacteria bacterium]|nr:URC4/urg3 family protein [Pseudomonadota bacterium]
MTTNSEAQPKLNEEISLLRDPTTIRARCNEIYQLGLAGALKHFRVDSAKLPDVVKLVIQVTKESYPDLNVPYHSRWSHFSAGDTDRIGWLKSQLTSEKVPPLERARIFYDLVVPSILLDAGAGMKWSYDDLRSGTTLSKSEGLAVASFDMFTEGLFSSDPKRVFQTDAKALEEMRSDVLANGFQVSKDNPLVGIEGRLALLKNLGHALRNETYFGGVAHGRVGALVDYLVESYGAKEIQAKDVFAAVLAAFGGIWPGRIALHDVNLGDVWKHSQAKGPGATAGLICFHKLSQWLTYSLFEPLEWCGIKIVGVEALTGLAEYRNGGLFIDMGVLQPVKQDAFKTEWSPGDEFIVEWRALTVALLDIVGDSVRASLGMTSAQLPLAKVLQGGTWAAGRKIAASLRADGGPPLRIKSDGTVF